MIKYGTKFIIMNKILNDLAYKGIMPNQNHVLDLNQKKISIVVAARQYPGGSFLSRGYGDIAAGNRVVSYVRKIFPNAVVSFVAEHYADDSQEIKTIKTIVSIPEVKSYILDGINPTNPPELVNNVNNLLETADFIIQGSTGLISPLQNEQKKYAKKAIGLSEYDRRTGCNYKNSGIIEYNMGFYANRLYLVEPSLDNIQFQDQTLRINCINPTSKGDTNLNKKVFYFAYGHTCEFTMQMLRVLLLIEGQQNREVALVSSMALCKDDFDQYMKYVILPNTCNYQSVELSGVDFEGQDFSITIFKNIAGQGIKKIHLLTVNNIANSDFLLLQKGSLLNYSSGDISTSDILSIGKIPIICISTKKILFLAFHSKMIEFCELPDNQKYYKFIEPWTCAASSFLYNGYSDYYKKTVAELAKLQMLISSEYHEFEQKLTNWLKKNNETENFILGKIKEIL